MDKSKIIKEVSVPKVIPMKESFMTKMKRAKLKADDVRAKEKMIQDIKWDQMRHGGRK